MPGRKYTAGSGYRYGFNGKENDNEVKGEGNQQDYGMRIYDTRLGRFLSVDPISNIYPELTPFQYASNSPISLIDIDGMEGGWELSSPASNLRYHYEMQHKLPEKKSPQAATASPKPVIQPTHSEAPPLALQQSKFRAMNLGLTLTPEQKKAAEQRAIVKDITNQPAIKQGGYQSTDQYIIQKERVKLAYKVSKYAPVTGDLHDIKDVLSNVSKGDFVAAGMSAVFLIPGSDFLKPIKSVVKTDKQILKYAKQTFEGNKALSKEATDLVDKYRKGLDGGIGGHQVFEGVSELRGKLGSRVYFREGKDGVEILGYSNKNNQSEVINRLKTLYEKKN